MTKRTVGWCRFCKRWLYREGWNGPVKGHKPGCPGIDKTLL